MPGHRIIRLGLLLRRRRRLRRHLRQPLVQPALWIGGSRGVEVVPPAAVVLGNEPQYFGIEGVVRFSVGCELDQVLRLLGGGGAGCWAHRGVVGRWMRGAGLDDEGLLLGFAGAPDVGRFSAHGPGKGGVWSLSGGLS